MPSFTPAFATASPLLSHPPKRPRTHLSAFPLPHIPMRHRKPGAAPAARPEPAPARTPPSRTTPVAQLARSLRNAFDAAILQRTGAPVSSRPSLTSPATPPEGLSYRRVTRLLRAAHRLAAPFWRSDRAALLHLSACVALVLLDSLVGLAFTTLSGDLMTALSERNFAAFVNISRNMLISCVVISPVVPMNYFATQTLELRWRQFLTKKGMGLYFERRNYYRLAAMDDGGSRGTVEADATIGLDGTDDGVDNPDEIIDSQFANFVHNMVDFSLSNIRNVFDLFLYSILLLRIFPPVYGIIIVMVVAATLVINRIGRRLIDLEAEILRRSANFRFSLARIRIHAEAIAFYDGARLENANATAKLDALAETNLHACKAEFPVNTFVASFYFLPFIIPTVFMAPHFFKGKMALGELTKATYAFDTVFDNLAMFVKDYNGYANLGASVERLSNFVADLEQGKPLEEREFGVGSSASQLSKSIQTDERTIQLIEDPTLKGLVLSHLCVTTPKGQQRLLDNLNIKLGHGERLLIVGRSGFGKTSLLRTLAGLWTSGSGTIRRPLLNRTFFLPQRPYAMQGTLREQLTYPRGGAATDSELLETLKDVCLPDLAKRCGGLEATHDWADYLSSGEGQRVAFARLMLAKPDLALIDEGTSAIDLATERVLMKLVQRLGCTVVSVGHRPSLVEFHDVVLHLKDGDIHTQSAQGFSFPGLT